MINRCLRKNHSERAQLIKYSKHSKILSILINYFLPIFYMLTSIKENCEKNVLIL